MPKYKRKQYSLKQYGIYETKDSSSFYILFGEFKRARIKIKLKNGYSIWVYQYSPIQMIGKYDKIRITTNTNDRIFSQSFSYPGNHQVRIRTISKSNNNKNETISSKMMIAKGEK